MSTWYVDDDAAGQGDQAGNRLSDGEDGPNAYPAKLERGLNLGKKHEEALQAPVEHGVPARKAWNDDPACGGDISAFYIDGVGGLHCNPVIQPYWLP